MAINLSKGQKVDLTKGNPGLSKIVVGLGWDEVQKKGLLGGLFGGGQAEIDCDASAFLCTDGRLLLPNPLNQATVQSSDIVFSAI